MAEKECIICGEIIEAEEGHIDCCCGYSMFFKCDLDLLREAGWSKNRGGSENGREKTKKD